MKKRIINILLYLLKKSGYKDTETPFKPTTVVNVCDFHRLEFRKIVVPDHKGIVKTDTERYISDEETLLSMARRELKKHIEFTEPNIYGLRFMQLTIYTRKNKEL